MQPAPALARLRLHAQQHLLGEEVRRVGTEDHADAPLVVAVPLLEEAQRALERGLARLRVQRRGIARLPTLRDPLLAVGEGWLAAACAGPAPRPRSSGGILTSPPMGRV